MGNFAENLNLGNRVRPPPRPLRENSSIYYSFFVISFFIYFISLFLYLKK